MMRRACVVMLAAFGLMASAASAGSFPWRQPCVGSWNTVSSIDTGSATVFQFDGEIACGINVPHDLPSQMNLRIPKDQCTAGIADGGLEIRASDQDVWSYMKLDWAPGAGFLELTDPESFGAAYVTPYYN